VERIKYTRLQVYVMLDGRIIQAQSVKGKPANKASESAIGASGCLEEPFVNPPASHAFALRLVWNGTNGPPESQLYDRMVLKTDIREHIDGGAVAIGGVFDTNAAEELAGKLQPTPRKK